MSCGVEQITIAYLERRYAALEKEIENALQHGPIDHPAKRELRYADNSQSVSQQTGSFGRPRRKTGRVCRTRNFAASQSKVAGVARKSTRRAVRQYAVHAEAAEAVKRLGAWN